MHVNKTKVIISRVGGRDMVEEGERLLINMSCCYSLQCCAIILFSVCICFMTVPGPQ